jgi:hypothetical protein
MSNECLRVEDPDGMQEEHKRFIPVRAEECPTSSAYSRGYKRTREGGAPRSRMENGVCVTRLVPSQSPGELSVRV